MKQPALAAPESSEEPEAAVVDFLSPDDAQLPGVNQSVIEYLPWPELRRVELPAIRPASN